MNRIENKATIAVIVLISIALLLALLYWLAPKQQLPADSVDSSNSMLANSNAQPTPNNTAANNTGAVNSASQMGTEVNCQLSVDAANRLIVNEPVKNCFEYFITQYGEKDIQQIQASFLSFIQKSYQDPALGQIRDLWTRYLDYRQDLSELQTPNSNPESAAYYQGIYDQTQNLRKKYFSKHEIEGLFGPENTYHQYTLDRLRILENKKLSETEKARQLSALFDNLPESWKENLEQIATLDNLRKLTKDLKARNASAQELRQMRMNLVGAEATQRLETLDSERSAWKDRVSSYLGQRDQILKSGMGDNAKQQAIQNLKAQQFNNPQEQTRLQTFETVHDQGGKLPFSD